MPASDKTAALRRVTSILVIVAWLLASAALVKRTLGGEAWLTRENGIWVAFTGVAVGWLLARRAPRASTALLLIGGVALFALAVKGLLTW